MTPYIVRLKENHEIVGIYCLPSASDIFDIVDETCDPYLCEYAGIGAGGIAWPTKVASVIPAEEEFDFAGAELSELWAIRIGFNELSWKEVFKP